MRLALIALALALAGCAAICPSSLDKPAAEANQENLRAIVAENDAYNAADASTPEALKATRRARNAEALKLAENMAKAAK